MKCPSLPNNSCCVAALAVVLSLCPLPDAVAQDQPAPPPVTSRGENFSAGKPPAQLFASDCTGAGCHKGPQGLGKGQFPGALASFLREHYTNSRESAAALAGYLSGIASASAPREARTPPPRPGKPAAAAAAPAPSSPGWGEGIIAIEPRPTPNEARAPRQSPGGRTSRAAARPDDEPAGTPPVPPLAIPPSAVEPAEAPAKPTPTARAPRGRQPAAAALEAPRSSMPEAAAAPPPPAPKAPKQFDIFD